MALAPARKIPSLVRKLVLERIPVPPALPFLCRILRILFDCHIAVLERGNCARTRLGDVI